MKHFFTKLVFIAILLLGVSSFVVMKQTSRSTKQDVVDNIRFNSEMDNGFEERESRF